MNLDSGSVSEDITLEARGIKKSFGKTLSLRGIDLAVEKGESVVIFGPNGAGKTTLIKVLASIMRPSSGKVLINGLDAKEEAEKARKQIGVVTHQILLYQNLTPRENLEFYSRLYSVPEHKKRTTHLLELVGMKPYSHQRVGTLSRGMQQRVTIARSLLHKPSVMLLDEPETALDRQAVSMLWEAIGTEIQQKPTVITATHNLERGFEIGDRFLILDKGSVVFEGSKQSLDLPTLEKAYHSSVMVDL